MSELCDKAGRSVSEHMKTNLYLPRLIQNDIISNIHHSEVTLQWRHSGRDSVSNQQPHDCFFFIQSFIQAQIKENTKAPRHWPLYGEFTKDQ